MCIRETCLFHNDISSHFKFLLSNERLDFCEKMTKIWWPRELNALQIEKNHLQIKKTTSSIWQHTGCKYSQHNQKRNALQIKCICLCCEHLHHLLSNWWKCFLDLLVLFLFACVFWSCSALSSLGHHTKMINNADYFSQPSLIIFTKGADIFGHDCIPYIYIPKLLFTCFTTPCHYNTSIVIFFFKVILSFSMSICIHGFW